MVGTSHQNFDSSPRRRILRASCASALARAADGWAPLCAFLGVALPNEPFPNLNDRESVKKIIRDIIKGSYIMLGLSVVAVLAAVAALWWWLG